MSQLQRNLVANFLGRGLAVLLSFAFIPVYIHFLGIEAYGLIGFYAVLVGIFAIADAGLGATLNREMARLSALENQEQKMHDTFLTIEAIYLALSIFIAIMVIVSAPFTASSWIKSTTIPIQTLQTAIVMMGIAMALQFPLGLYQGGLIGLQRQVLLNIVLAISAIMRSVGAVVTLWLVSSTIDVFFLWQIVMNLALLIALRKLNWRSLPSAPSGAEFKFVIFQSVWRFSVSMLGMSIISALLIQTDKLVVSKLLPLQDFGYYTLAATVAQTLTIVSGPMLNAVFPKMTQLVLLNHQTALVVLFHQMCQLMSVLVIPAGLVLVAFSQQLLTVWARNEVTVQNTFVLVSLFTIGSIFLTLQVIPYALAMANGWLNLNLIIGNVTILVVIPMMVVLVTHYGAIGGAVAWVVINGVTTPFYIHFLLQRLLPGQEMHWYTRDVGAPLLAALGVVVIGKVILDPLPMSLVVFLGVICVFAVSFLAAALSAATIRQSAFHLLKPLVRNYFSFR